MRIVLNYDVIQPSLHTSRYRQIKICQYFNFTRFQGKPPNLKTVNISSYMVCADNFWSLDLNIPESLRDKAARGAVLCHSMRLLSLQIGSDWKYCQQPTNVKEQRRTEKHEKKTKGSEWHQKKRVKFVHLTHILYKLCVVTLTIYWWWAQLGPRALTRMLFS